MARVKEIFAEMLELLLWLVGVLTLLQILFGNGFVEFFGIDILSNIGNLVSQFGNAGLIGLIAAGLVAWLIAKSVPSNSSDKSD